jgi:hypothetical protein
MNQCTGNGLRGIAHAVGARIDKDGLASFVDDRFFVLKAGRVLVIKVETIGKHAVPEDRAGQQLAAGLVRTDHKGILVVDATVSGGTALDAENARQAPVVQRAIQILHPWCDLALCEVQAGRALFERILACDDERRSRGAGASGIVREGLGGQLEALGGAERAADASALA